MCLMFVYHMINALISQTMIFPKLYMIHKFFPANFSQTAIYVLAMATYHNLSVIIM